MYCWATYHCQQYKNTECCATIRLWPFNVAGNNKTYLGIYVKWPIFFSGFNLVGSFWTTFHKSSQYQMFRKCPVGTALIHANKRTDRRAVMTKPVNKRLPWRRECAEKSPSSVTRLFFFSETCKLFFFFKFGLGSCATSIESCFICMP